MGHLSTLNRSQEPRLRANPCTELFRHRPAVARRAAPARPDDLVPLSQPRAFFIDDAEAGFVRVGHSGRTPEIPHPTQRCDVSIDICDFVRAEMPGFVRRVFPRAPHANPKPVAPEMDEERARPLASRPINKSVADARPGGHSRTIGRQAARRCAVAATRRKPQGCYSCESEPESKGGIRNSRMRHHRFDAEVRRKFTFDTVWPRGSSPPRRPTPAPAPAPAHPGTSAAAPIAATAARRRSRWCDR